MHPSTCEHFDDIVRYLRELDALVARFADTQTQQQCANQQLIFTARRSTHMQTTCITRHMSCVVCPSHAGIVSKRLNQCHQCRPRLMHRRVRLTVVTVLNSSGWLSWAM